LLLFDESLSLAGAVRVERSSVNGDPNAFHYYPKAALAYSIPLVYLPSDFDLVKVRMAYGETGNHPLYGRKFTSLSTNNSIGGMGGLLNTGVAGDSNIQPERQREVEAGIDFMAFDGRATLEVTVYQRNITDLLLERTMAPSTGYKKQFLNGGELRNRGLEILLEATLFKTPKFEWLSRTSFAMNRSLVLSLPVPAFSAGGFAIVVGEFWIEEGASATQITGLQPEGRRKIGDTEPDFTMGFFNRFKFDRFSLSFLLHWQQGSEIVNLSRFTSDNASNSGDWPAGKERLGHFLKDTRAVLIESATFLKLREISLGYDLPDAWAESLSANRLRISVSARNLLTLTPYSGADPEVSNFGSQAVGRNIDVNPFPPSRSFWLSIDLRI
jgi:hypothetical protein